MAPSVSFKQKDHKLRDWLGAVDLDEDTLNAVPAQALVANLGAVLETVHRHIQDKKGMEEDAEMGQ